MPNILVVGNATLDIINLVERYPGEDAEVRALAQYRRRGGNAANNAVVLAQLGNVCTFAGTLADEPDGQTIRDDLHRFGVDTRAVRMEAQGKAPTSYVTLSRTTGSRTIVHYRDLPEYLADDFARIPLDAFDWIHFEGRNVVELERMVQHCQASAPAVRLSIEAEKPRANLETLFSHVHVVLFSRVYAEHHGFREPESFLMSMRAQSPQAVLALGWGADGAYALAPAGNVIYTPAFPPPKVVDTLGAGDVFNAGFIDALAHRQPVREALIAAAQLAGRKCGINGLDGLFRDGSRPL